MSSEPADRSAPISAARSATQRPVRRWNKMAYAALFVVLALTAAQSARMGVAGFFAQLAQNEADQWQPGQRSPSVAQVDRAANYYSNSLLYASGNPLALEGAGAMALARMRATKIPREALSAAKDARTRFRQALRQRPTSPFLWANLALTKLYLDEIDGELLAALRHADELGPWEPSVQQTFLFVGLAVWQDLDPGLRRALEQTLQRGASRNIAKMYEIVKSYARLDLVCAIPEYKLVAGSGCGKFAESVPPREPKSKGNGR